MPTRVKSVEFLDGGEGVVGTVFKVTYLDDSHWNFKVTKISDTHHFISYELVFAEPSVSFQVINCISLWRVTKDNTTFIKWTSDFSNDADANVIQDNKYKKLEAFDTLGEALEQMNTADIYENLTVVPEMMNKAT